MMQSACSSADLDLLDPVEAATILKLVKRDGEPAVRTLERWRTEGTGPKFIRLGRRVLYRRSDLEDFVRRRTLEHTNG